jgi:hypothetical protein
MIHYKNTIEAIYLQIDEVQQLVSNFGAQGKIPGIEIDLALDKLRHVYDLMLSLRIENNGYGDFQESGTIPFEVEEQKVQVEEIIPVKGSSIKDQIMKEEAEFQEAKEKTRAEKESRVRVGGNESFGSETLKPKTNYNLDEQASEKARIDLSTQFKTKPVSNLTNAMGLNEKFELIHHLFGGDKNKFEQTMNYLNAASDFNEAYEYLSGNFNWDMNDNSVQKILELVRRKLIVKKNER